MYLCIKTLETFGKIIITFSVFGLGPSSVIEGKSCSDFLCYFIAVTNKILSLTAQESPIITGWSSQAGYSNITY